MCQPHFYVMLRVSPDGQYAVLDARDEELDLFLWDFKRGKMERLTSEPDSDGVSGLEQEEPGPAALPEFRPRRRAGAVPDGSASCARATHEIPRSVNIRRPSARTEGGWSSTAVRAAGLTMVSTDGDHEARALPGVAAEGANADISPDGQWIAYESSGSGGSEIYVHPFPDTAAFRRQVGEGTRPLWSPVGGELFYLDADRQLMSVRVVTTPTFSIGNPTKMLENVRVITPGRSYDISPDGKRFLVLKDAPGGAQSIRQLEVVLNWQEELKQRIPTR